MKIDEELALLAPERDSVLTIGVFDGVHRGHRHLVNRLMRKASAAGRLVGVVTFSNHPASVLRPDFWPQYLTDLDERKSLFRKLGVDFVVPITFDLELSKLSASQFVSRLQRHLRMRELVVGPDFALGHKREGDPGMLSALGEKTGFSVEVVDLLVEEGQAIRSTLIRKALSQGAVTSVAKMLGRNFTLTGVVVKGLGRGRTLGFPTANLAVGSEMLVPADGIYATWAHLGERRFMAAASIGTRPTFDEGGRTIEAFILDFDKDLYDQKLCLEFVRHLRNEEKYDTVEALLQQINKDVGQTRGLLRSADAGGRSSDFPESR